MDKKTLPAIIASGMAKAEFTGATGAANVTDTANTVDDTDAANDVFAIIASAPNVADATYAADTTTTTAATGTWATTTATVNPFLVSLNKRNCLSYPNAARRHRILCMPL